MESIRNEESPIKHTTAGEMPDASSAGEYARRMAADSAILSPRLWGKSAWLPVLGIGAAAVVGYFAISRFLQNRESYDRESFERF